MKKAGIFLFILFIYILGTVALIHAQSEPSVPFANEAGKITDISQNPETTGSYLKQELGKIILNKPIIGPIIKVINYVLNLLDPFFKLVLGVEYSFSWAFFFAVVIWIILFVLLFPVASGLFNGKLFGFIAAFVITSLIGLSGVIRRTVDILTEMINNKWIAGISLVIAILIAVIMYFVGGGIKKMMQKGKEQEAKKKEERDREVLHTSAELEKEKLEGG